MRICKIDGCNKKHKGHGYCQIHLIRFKKHGDPLYIAPKKIRGICKVEECDNPHIALGYCNKHYVRFKKYGDPLFTKIKTKITKKEYHGMSDTPEYHVWENMIQRCYNESYKCYHRYGGRGIAVCNRWLYSFVNFYEDMGDKPFPRAEIDREKNNLGYFKDNCRWVTHSINNQNKDKNVVKMNCCYVTKMRDLYETGLFTQKDLAQIYKLSTTQTGNIVTYQRWKNIEKTSRSLKSIDIPQ